MARATFVKRARKDIPSAGIKAGESYYWWKFRYGGKHYSKTPPKPSQLTQSEFLSSMLELEEQVQSMEADDGLPDAVQEVIDRLNEIADECEEKHSNMPDSLQDSDTGQLLERRAEACRDIANELESIDLDFEPNFDELDEDAPDYEDRKSEVKEEQAEAFWQEKLEEVQNVGFSYE